MSKQRRKSGIPKVEKRVYKVDAKSLDYEPYDSDNLYPQRMKDIINASGTAKRSVETFAKYIHGGGFKDQTFYKSIINKKGITADRLLRSVSQDYADYGGRAYYLMLLVLSDFVL